MLNRLGRSVEQVLAIRNTTSVRLRRYRQVTLAPCGLSLRLTASFEQAPDSRLTVMYRAVSLGRRQ